MCQKLSLICPFKPRGLYSDYFRKKMTGTLSMQSTIGYVTILEKVEKISIPDIRLERGEVCAASCLADSDFSNG